MPGKAMDAGNKDLEYVERAAMGSFPSGKEANPGGEPSPTAPADIHEESSKASRTHLTLAFYVNAAVAILLSQRI